jgi:hypothetical protein
MAQDSPSIGQNCPPVKNDGKMVSYMMHTGRGKYGRVGIAGIVPQNPPQKNWLADQEVNPGPGGGVACLCCASAGVGEAVGLFLEQQGRCYVGVIIE